MTEKKYPLDIGTGLVPRFQVTAGQAQEIGVQCANISVEAAKEATKPKNGDVGHSNGGNSVVFIGGEWMHLDGVCHAEKERPVTILFNIGDVLKQGSVVIGLDVRDARFFVANWDFCSGEARRFEAGLKAALERNK